MNQKVIEPLICDLVAWVANQPQPYSDVMERWRTSCPQLPVWEEAVDRGLVERHRDENGKTVIIATQRGLTFLKRYVDHVRGP